MVECPADGCSYSGVKSSVLGHYSGKQDDAHAGGYQDAKQMLDGVEDGTAGAQAGGSADTSADTDTREDTSESGDNPIVGNGTPDSTDYVPDGKVELPCGHEYFEKSEAPDPPFAVTCGECGQTVRIKNYD